MSLYSKVTIQQAGEPPDKTARAALGDLHHEARRLQDADVDACDADPSLVFNTPKQVTQFAVLLSTGEPSLPP